MTTWDNIITGSDISKAKTLRSRTFITSKEKAADLPMLIDNGWEVVKEYKDPKYVQVKKEKPELEQFEDRLWLLLSSMGFSEMNANREFCIHFDSTSPERYGFSTRCCSRAFTRGNKGTSFESRFRTKPQR